MRSHLSYQAKRELLLQIAPRYREASSRLKEVILDEFVAATGYARKYAIRLLNHPADQKLTIARPRPPHYGPEVQHALHLAWTAANHICAKRLVPFLPTLVPSLERHGHVHLSEQCRADLLSMSPATADRILQPYRKQERHGLSTTKAGTLLKKQIPVRTFNDWNETKPGFMEADLVAHCGTHADGSYLYTLLADRYSHRVDRVPSAPQPRSGSRRRCSQASPAVAPFSAPGHRHGQRSRVYQCGEAFFL
jgi:hypothetical protein